MSDTPPTDSKTVVDAAPVDAAPVDAVPIMLAVAGAGSKDLAKPGLKTKMSSLFIRLLTDQVLIKQVLMRTMATMIGMVLVACFIQFILTLKAYKSYQVGVQLSLTCNGGQYLQETPNYRIYAYAKDNSMYLPVAFAPVVIVAFIYTLIYLALITFWLHQDFKKPKFISPLGFNWGKPQLYIWISILIGMAVTGSMVLTCTASFVPLREIRDKTKINPVTGLTMLQSTGLLLFVAIPLGALAYRVMSKREVQAGRLTYIKLEWMFFAVIMVMLMLMYGIMSAYNSFSLARVETRTSVDTIANALRGTQQDNAKLVEAYGEVNQTNLQDSKIAIELLGNERYAYLRTDPEQLQPQLEAMVNTDLSNRLYSWRFLGKKIENSDLEITTKSIVTLSQPQFIDSYASYVSRIGRDYFLGSNFWVAANSGMNMVYTYETLKNANTSNTSINAQLLHLTEENTTPTTPLIKDIFASWTKNDLGSSSILQMYPNITFTDASGAEMPIGDKGAAFVTQYILGELNNAAKDNVAPGIATENLRNAFVLLRKAADTVVTDQGAYVWPLLEAIEFYKDELDPITLEQENLDRIIKSVTDVSRNEEMIKFVTTHMKRLAIIAGIILSMLLGGFYMELLKKGSHVLFLIGTSVILLVIIIYMWARGVVIK